jgi:hypothetical protein
MSSANIEAMQRHPSLSDNQFVTSTGVVLTLHTNEHWAYVGSSPYDPMRSRDRLRLIPGSLQP